MTQPTPDKRWLCKQAKFLRDAIRSGAVECRCPYDKYGQRAHSPNCGWVNAVNDIYTMERLV